MPANHSRNPSRNIRSESDVIVITIIANERGADEKQHVATADAALVQAAHALRVDEHRTRGADA